VPDAKITDHDIMEKLKELAKAKKRYDERMAKLPSKKEALEISKRKGCWVRGKGNRWYLYADPAETARYDVWLRMKQHVLGLAEPKYSAEAFAAATDDFWRSRFPTHIDAAIAYLNEVKRHLENQQQ
jgi:hypothetical protein